MPLTGNVNYALYFPGCVSSGPLETGIGTGIVPTTDASGIQLSLGDLIVFPNPTPGANGLPNTPKLAGAIVAFGGSLLTANVPSTTQVGVAVAVFNVPANQCLQLYSAVSPGNAEHTSMQ